MLKNIRLHLEKDKEKQALFDEMLAKQVIDMMKSNVNAFQRNIPSLIPYISGSKLTTYSLFKNRYGETNLVNYGIGRTLYGLHPSEEISLQVKQALQHSPCVDLTQNVRRAEHDEETKGTFDFRELKSFKIEQAQSPLPEEVECLVVLGCGLGLHIKQLLERRKIKNLIIYEPEIQYFQCSVLSTSWQEIFALAKKQGTRLFLQLLKDGRELVNDINELKENISLSSFHIYKHYNQQVFDAVYRDLTERDWIEICNNGFTITPINSHLDYIPTWTPKIDLTEQTPVSNECSQFKKNLEALKQHFPDIYLEYKDYQPKTWLPIKSAANEVNILKTKDLSTWYGASPKQDCIQNFDNFNEQPNIDGLKLGYNQTKLAHYIHYQFVNDTQKLLKEAEAQEDLSELPETISSIIMLGIGVGYQLEKLLNEHSVEKLFICEPNPDFFYASLFAIDWQAIFEKAQATDATIYLNVGGDGTDLFQGLLEQFQVIGSYILNSTYIYQGYHNAFLNPAIAELKDQLQIVIAIGENFDYTFYSIEHTKEGFRRNIPVLIKNPSGKLSYADKEVPIFILGNGPSLDMSIEAIKEYRGQVIVISCGTALQALHRNGITPDFHAEVEKNRCTYDWAVLIGDLAFLKKITLISTNGIHPDTCELYKDVLIAFKEGESSTVSALKVLGKQHFELLQYSYPTVSNFATNLFSVLGFNHIYLMGVDLGFSDVNHHHSKSSGYYQDNGKETFDYAKGNDTSLIVPGNFRPRVNTKHEFKLSCGLIEKVTQTKPKEQTFYNCSDGARIKGTIPLHLDDLFIVATTDDKINALQQMRSAAYSTEFNSNFIEKYEKQFSHDLLVTELDAILKILEKDISCQGDVKKIINEQQKTLLSSYSKGHSLLFYYLYGTMNYANAILSKLLYLKAESDNKFLKSNLLIDKWSNTLGDIEDSLKNEYRSLDHSAFSQRVREGIILERHLENRKILIITNSLSFAKSCKWLIENNLTFIKNATITTYEQRYFHSNYDYVIYYDQERIRGKVETVAEPKLNVLGEINTLVIVHGLSSGVDADIKEKVVTCINSSELNQENDIIFNNLSLAGVALKACIEVSCGQLIIPRINTIKGEPFNLVDIYNKSPLITKVCKAIKFSYYSVIFETKLAEQACLSKSGSRGEYAANLNNSSVYTNQQITREQLDEASKTYEDKIPELFDNAVFSSQINIINK
ncbi:6-hydroxymethylpterin diphosphokinase MptE-like protein [Paraglaciecola polaris]|uniref:6-hydroxymethylpterin diphosphokinase MptE-like protein n=1 Tax=Paraglaciecola polaris TaxID=222814 RepID=UPI0030EBDEEF|tara:strand:- start:230 stop:3841 length:3612 start_codon:yes stop_codon:yes gene_type:complete